MPNPHHRMSHRSRNPRLPVSASGRAAASKLRREPHSQRAAWAVQEKQKGGVEDAVLGNGLSWNLPADTGAAGAAMISWSHPTPLCLMPSMLACVLPIPAPCPDNMQSHAPRHPTPCPPCMHVLPLARMPSAHALPHPHTQHACVLSPTPSTHVRPSPPHPAPCPVRMRSPPLPLPNPSSQDIRCLLAFQDV